MEELLELKQSVTKMISAPNEIRDEFLQKINAILLTQYVISVNNVIIEPL